MNQQVRAMVTQEEEIEDEGAKPEEELHETETVQEEIQEEEASPFQLSVHAVQGTSSSKQTFTLRIHLGKMRGTALVDSGSSSTFIVTEMALKAGCPIQNSLVLRLRPIGLCVYIQSTPKMKSYPFKSSTLKVSLNSTPLIVY